MCASAGKVHLTSGRYNIGNTTDLYIQYGARHTRGGGGEGGNVPLPLGCLKMAESYDDW